MKVGQAAIDASAIPAGTLAQAGLHVTRMSGSGPATGALLRGQPVPVEQVSAELGHETLAALVSCGLWQQDGHTVTSEFRGHVVGGRLVFTDPDVEEDEQDPLYLDPLWEAELLVRLMQRRQGRRALDVGCGCGVLSLLLAPDYDEVLGVDISPRAIEMSQFNAGLGGVANAKFRASDMFGEVDGEFDRIVFNSPTNEEGDQFRDLLEAGEGILRTFFAGLPEHLAGDGIAEVNLAMNDYPGSLFADRLSASLGLPQSGIDVAILVSQRVTGEAGHVWKRGWLVAAHGQGRVAEVDWPYHDLAEGTDTPLSDTVWQLVSGSWSR